MRMARSKSGGLIIVSKSSDAVNVGHPEGEAAGLAEIKQEIRTRIRVKVSDIKDNPFSLSIFPPEPDPQLIESIRLNGLLELPVVDQDMVLQRGHRRVHGCRFLGLTEIDVEVTSITNPRVLKLMVIEHNRTRVKTWRIRLREAEELKLLHQPLAKNNQRSAGKSGGLNYAKAHHVRSQLAKHLGVSHETLRRVQLIAQQNPALLDDIDAGDESINSVYRQVVKAMPGSLRLKRERPNLLTMEHNRAAYALGREIAGHLRFPYPVTGPAYSFLLQGLRDALETKPSPVDLSDCQSELVAMAPFLFEGLAGARRGTASAAAPAAAFATAAIAIPGDPYCEPDDCEEDCDVHERANAPSDPVAVAPSTASVPPLRFPQLRPVRL